MAAAPSTGVDTLTGEGLAEVLKGADVVVDVANSPSFEKEAALDFFTRAMRHLIIGVDEVPELGCHLAKVAQEEAGRASGVPFSILRVGQFFEFVGPPRGCARSPPRTSPPSSPRRPRASS
ncbi:hypothetical protein ACFYZ2_03725 [Streptomyces sviceus]|uniref:hypothetical protein n=1 Tax=Streptomyces sviceus TaxID=285530 RepID=UPI00369784D7